MSQMIQTKYGAGRIRKRGIGAQWFRKWAASRGIRRGTTEVEDREELKTTCRREPKAEECRRAESHREPRRCAERGAGLSQC